MVGKLDTKQVDKTADTVPTYRVTATVETHDEKGRKGQEERREEDEYSESTRIKGWQKFHTDAKDRRPVKLRTRDIAKLFYNQVFLQKGLVIIDADLHLINGKIFKNAHLFSTKIDTYWKLKKMNIGQEIPVKDLITEQYVEVSVYHKGRVIKTKEGRPVKTGGPKPRTYQPIKEWSLWPLIDEETKKLNWIALTIYLIIIVAVIIGIMIVL